MISEKVLGDIHKLAARAAGRVNTMLTLRKLSRTEISVAQEELQKALDELSAFSAFIESKREKR